MFPTVYFLGLLAILGIAAFFYYYLGGTPGFMKQKEVAYVPEGNVAYTYKAKGDREFLQFTHKGQEHRVVYLGGRPFALNRVGALPRPVHAHEAASLSALLDEHRS